MPRSSSRHDVIIAGAGGMGTGNASLPSTRSSRRMKWVLRTA